MTLSVPKLFAVANFKIDSEDVAAEMSITAADVAAGRGIGLGHTALCYTRQFYLGGFIPRESLLKS